MNKKVLTLCAGFLLAGSLTAVAQYCPANGEVDYRTRVVKSATLDAVFQNVNKINQEYYYQLQVNPKTLGINSDQQKEAVDYVLAVERDYSTGKLYLTAQPITNTTLTHTLWQIKVTDRSANGRVYSYVNKETGFELTFDHTNALQVDPTSASGNKSIKVPANYERGGKNNANVGWNYEEDGLMDGCTSNWAWYTTDDVTGNDPFGYKRIYSYFHNETDSVMTLAAVPNITGDANNDLGANLIYSWDGVKGLADNPDAATGVDKGLNGKNDGGFAIVAIKDSKFGANDFIEGLGAFPLEIRPVVAGAKVLTADEINTMIDADGSWLTFGSATSSNTIANYEKWTDGANLAPRKGSETKFTVCKPGTEEAVDLASNPFADKLIAVESNDVELQRKKISGSGLYAGYNVLFQTKEPLQVDDNGDEQWGYLYVSEYPYEGQAFQGIYNGLQVKIAPYSHLEYDATTNTKSKKTDLKEVTGEINPATGTQKYSILADALQARYHWKVTYYATNDSVVFEPLNASRMSQSDMTLGKRFEQTDLAFHSGAQYLNTVNAGVAYATGAVNPNTMYAKAAGVPVALYAMNFGPAAGDKASYLTVAYATGKTLDGKTAVDASNAQFAALLKSEAGNPAYVTNNTKAPYQSAMEMVARFDNNYTYLKRASVTSGVYFINLKTNKFTTGQSENRVNDAYIVEDMKGHVVYDTQDEAQNFSHMPATQWVVEQQPCLDGDDVNKNENPVVRIYNREFNGEDGHMTPMFAGQLYTAGDGKLFTIDHRHYARLATPTTVDQHARYTYNCADTVAFTPVEVNELGYFNASEDELRESVYQFQHMYNMNLNNFLGIGEDKKTVKLVENGSTEFELFRAQGWYPVADSIDVLNKETGIMERIPTNPQTYHFEYRDFIDYGYASELAGATQLRKTVYKVKVKDTNLIDNDHTFLAINNQHKYVVATEQEIENKENHLSYAIVALKENNDLNGEHGYALVNVPQYTFVDGAASELKDLQMTILKNDLGIPYRAFYVDVNPNDGAYNANDVVKVRMDINNIQINGKLAIESVSLDAKIADLCETTTDAFALVQNDNKRYATLSDEYVNNEKKVIDLTTIDEQSNQSLYEDSGSKLAIANGLNYLAAENMGDPTSREGFYVDKVAKSKEIMPQYLLAVAADSIPAYTYCDCAIHDVKHGINSGCQHSENYAGYVEGRFLVNFNDSVQNAINRLENADAFRSANYTRLGFVEAVHRGDSLYVLKAPYTLASIKEESKDGSGMIINPLFLSADSLGKVYDIVPLDGNHNNVAFSLRNTGDEYNSVMIESNDMPNDENGKPQSKFSQVGSFAGAWVKLLNGVPVLAKFYDVNGNHNTGDGTDSWKDQEDWQPIASEGEVINQAARFTFKAIDKDASATANEEIAAEGNVSVVAENGAVVVKGAEGKNVIVSTILGKVVANEVLNSDNAKIAAPAGIVVVSVDGESFKVVVK